MRTKLAVAWTIALIIVSWSPLNAAAPASKLLCEGTYRNYTDNTSLREGGVILYVMPNEAKVRIEGAFLGGNFKLVKTADNGVGFIRESNGESVGGWINLQTGEARVTDPPVEPGVPPSYASVWKCKPANSEKH